MPEQKDKGSGSTHLGAHVRRQIASAAGGGTGQFTAAYSEVVRGGHYWRLLSVVLKTTVVSGNQFVNIGILPGTEDAANFSPLPLILLPILGIAPEQEFGGDTRTVVPQGWRICFTAHDVAAAESVIGSAAYLEIPVGDHCYV